MAKLTTIVNYLNRALRISDFKDVSNNGLQVENSGRVNRICCGVDASQAFFDEANKRNADLLICHHGISWGDSLKYLTDLNYHRVASLINNDMALYAAHLPLDAHPRHGNNAVLFKALGLQDRKPFGNYHGNTIGFRGRFASPMPVERFKMRVQKVCGQALQTMEFGKQTIRTVAIVSGGGSDMLPEAAAAGVDAYLSGEPTLPAYHMAQEYGMHVIYAGHYATEVFGVRALADALSKRFKIQAEFIPMNVPF